MNPDRTRDFPTKKALLWLCVLELACGMLAIVLGPPAVFLPIALAIMFVSFIWPRAGLQILVISWFFPYALSESMGLFPADLVLFCTAGGYTAKSLALGRWPVRKTPLNLWILLWVAALLTSALFALDLPMALKNWLRHVQLFLLFYTIVGLVEKADIRNTVGTFLGLCLTFSPWNIFEFVRAGGAIRAFGPAHVLFSGFLALAGTFATAAFLFADSARERTLWAFALCVLVGGQMANESRGAMIQMVSGMLFATGMAYRWSRMHKFETIRRRIASLLVVGAIAAIVVLLVAAPLVTNVLVRYSSQEGNPHATAQMRLFLWSSALRMFVQHPFFGVGLAQQDVLGEILPFMKYNPLYLHVRGLGFHNSMIGYLAETGIVGSVLLFMLLVAALRVGRGLLPRMRDPHQAMWLVGIWSIVFVIVTRYLYEGHIFYSVSGMITVTFFAFLIALRRQWESIVPPESR
ncbi:MAG: O-antigen ligase family protein [candidate division Zixibacteria bacterium]|nr:O-antigen ligase family protein [candidate division Zixibacteria bacterium]